MQYVSQVLRCEGSFSRAGPLERTRDSTKKDFRRFEKKRIPERRAQCENGSRTIASPENFFRYAGGFLEAPFPKKIDNCLLASHYF